MNGLWRHDFTQEMWLLFTEESQSLTWCFKKWSDNKTGWADPKVFQGMLVSDLGNENKGELDMPRLSSSEGELSCTCDLNRYNTWKHEIDHTYWFCNYKTTYPTYLPSIFSSFCMGALGLADPDYPFFFWLPSYLNVPLYHPGAQIKLLSTLSSLLIYKSAKIKLFGQIFILYILQQEIET